jgi:hypothetical protein
MRLQSTVAEDMANVEDRASATLLAATEVCDAMRWPGRAAMCGPAALAGRI